MLMVTVIVKYLYEHGLHSLISITFHIYILDRTSKMPSRWQSKLDIQKLLNT